MLEANEINKLNRSNGINLLQALILLSILLLCLLSIPTAKADSPEQYGAIADDDGDDTAALQAAIDNHNNIYLTGQYRISSTLRLRDGVRIHSDGLGGLFMVATDGFNNVSQASEFASNAVGLLGENIENISLQNFRIVKEFQDRSHVAAIAIRRGHRIDISGLDVSGFSNGLVISLDSVNWAFVSSNLIHGSYTSSEAQHTAIAIDSSRVVDNGVILNSNSVMVRDNFIMGLRVSPELRNRNRVETDGIHIAGPEAHDIWLINNAIAEVGEGIDNFGQRVNVRGNTMYANYIFGIKLAHGAASNFVSQNSIVKPAKVGIVLAGSNTVARHTRANSVVNNYISGVGQHVDINWRPQFTAGISLEANGGQTGSVVGNLIDQNRIADTAQMDFGVICEVPYDNQISNLQLQGQALREGLRECP